eukprot:154520_1
MSASHQHTQIRDILYIEASDRYLHSYNLTSNVVFTPNAIAHTISVDKWILYDCITHYNDMIIELGGSIGNGIFLGKYWIYDLISQQWSNRTSMLIPRRFLNCEATQNGFLYAIGGEYGQDLYTKTVEVIDVKNISSNWSTLSHTLSRSTRWDTSVIHKTDIYVILGSIVNVIDTITNTITTYPVNLNSYRIGPAAIIVDYILYVFGGRVNTWEYTLLPIPFHTTWIKPLNNSFIYDPYSRFEISAEILLNTKIQLQTDLNDLQFVWQYTTNGYTWNDIDDSSNFVAVYSAYNANQTLISTLIIASPRVSHIGFCADPNIVNNHIFQNGNEFKFRVTVFVRNEHLYQSNSSLHITVNSVPIGGYCNITGFNSNSFIFDSFGFNCSGWNSSTNIVYNTLVNDVLINGRFVNDPSTITSVIGVGNLEFTMLIKDSYGAISCFEIQNNIHVNYTQFISNINSILDELQMIIINESVCRQLSDIVTLYAITEEIYNSNLIAQDDIISTIDLLIEYTINCLDVTQTNFFLRDYILSELATFSSITSNGEIINGTSLSVLIEQLLPLIESQVDIFIANDSNINSSFVIQDALYSVSLQSELLVENMESSLTNINSTNTSLIDYSELLIDYSSSFASKALLQSLPGETFYFESSIKTVTAYKFEINEFNSNASNINCDRTQIPNSFLTQNPAGYYDCTYMSSSLNHFNSDQVVSNIVSVDIFNNNSQKQSFLSDGCDPYFITIHFDSFSIQQYEIGNNYTVPLCMFWNTSDNQWQDSGCYLYNITENNDIICACSHLTTLSVDYTDFVPEYQLISEWHLRNVDELINCPHVSLVLVSTLLLIFICCLINPRKRENRTMLSYEDVIYVAIRDNLLENDIHGKEIKYLSEFMPNSKHLGYGLKEIAPDNETRKSVCYLVFRLFKVYIRNDHTVLSVFQRTAGTNYSARQRLGCLFLYISLTMAATAIFYGVEQAASFGDVSASFCISLLSTFPVLFIKKLFQKSKPKEIKSTDSLIVTHRNSIRGNDTEIDGKETDITKHKKSKVKMGTVGDITDVLNKQKSINYKQTRIIQLTSDIREIIFNSMYPLPAKCKQISWYLLAFLSLIASVIAILYGLQFDLQFTNTM